MNCTAANGTGIGRLTWRATYRVPWKIRTLQGAKMDDRFIPPREFKIVSGGQSGADQAGLDWAMSRDLPHGGWCPKGRKSETGPLDQRYSLSETPTTNYVERTEWNVRDSDATLIFTLTGKLDGGSRRTAELAAKLGKPYIHIHPRVHPQYIVLFLTKNNVKTLNIAGKRESSAPETYKWVTEMLGLVFKTGLSRDSATGSRVSQDRREVPHRGPGISRHRVRSAGLQPVMKCLCLGRA